MTELAMLAALALAQGEATAVLEASCVKCHNPGKKKGGLDLSTRESLLRGGDQGPAVIPGKARESLLYRLAAHEQDPHMPHRAPKLADDALRRLAAWIDAGAPYARPLAAQGEREIHWAFRPLRKVEPPAVRNESWVRTPVDRFILATLEAQGLAPNPPADPRTLLRRASFGLTGLPPSPEEAEAPELYERTVDRLLASPHYGERWGRHWLDVARYADSSGYESDYDRPHAYPYRDFLIRALNDDLPFDVFVRWQVAGDQIAPDNPLALAATGFCTSGPSVKTLPTDSRRNKERYRYDELDDIVSTAGSAFLGLTLGCARCHDHKYDPIPQRDYYALAAVFASSVRKERSLSPERRRLDEWLESRRTRLKEEKIAALGLPVDARELLRHPVDNNIVSSKKLHAQHGKAVQVADADLRAWLPEAERAAWEALEKAARAAPSAPVALTLMEGPPAACHLLARGDPDSKVEAVAPGVLSALSSPAPDPATPSRAALGAWLTDAERGAGPLVARVIANRLWQHHFGEGLVRTPNDFGAQGELPSHPDLLEWLAAELVRGGWRLKPLHRLLMTSAVYLQDATYDRRRADADPENRLLGRRRPVRLEAEALRDAILAVSGRLDRTLYGPPVKLPVPRAAIVTRTKDEYPKDVADGPPAWRRSLYAFTKRSVLVPFMETFDAPNASASCGRRARTIVAPQALALLNDPFVRARARDFAAQAEGDVERAYLAALGRPPRPAEREAAREFLSRGASFADFCHVLFTLNEFAYVD